MGKVNFLFGIHCHQPVGNFEHIFEEAYQKSYLPFLQVLERHPKIKCAVHYSGVLYDWFLEKRPEYIDYLIKLINRHQIEIMVGGYYEPILPIIPEVDQIGQINLQKEFVQSKLNYSARGLWLTERIWEPQLPQALSRAGIEYLMVDDSHFISAGILPEKLYGYYITEHEGETLKVFPISKKLRYMIPFKLPEETINYLRSLADLGSEGTAAIMADDGEKFGVWPDTYKWVYEEKYLERLFSMLEENCSWIEFMTFSEYLDQYPALGRVYMPTASYAEMMEWALPYDAGMKYEKLVQEIKKQNRYEDYQQFIKGGYFKNFFVKYPEANNMHKRMLQVSKKIQTLKKGKSLGGEGKKGLDLEKAERELYKGQCNCAYWHGVFGGLYLNYLRNAVYHHLIAAEREIDLQHKNKKGYVELSVSDLDKDGRDEIVLTNDYMSLFIDPDEGGGLYELDYKPKCFNLIDTLARRPEVYHEKIKNAALQGNFNFAEQTKSIHDVVRVKEQGLEKALVYDWHRRISLLDHFLAEDTTLEKFSTVAYQEEGDFVLGNYQYFPKKSARELNLRLYREGRVSGTPIRVDKNLTLFANQSVISIEYEINNLGQEKKSLWFAPEFDFSLLAPKADDRYYEIEGKVLEDKTLASRGEEEGVFGIKLVDNWNRFALSLRWEKTARLWRFPIETVSQSEGGFEKTFQNSVIVPSWKIVLGPLGKWKVRITLLIEE